jgi:hypothetical protein
MTHNEKGLLQFGKQNSVCPEPLLIKKLMMKISTKADRYSSAETEAK